MLPSSNEIFDVFPADGLPILISSPHSGQQVPDDISVMMTPEGSKLPDTDLFVNDLYSFAPKLGICLVSAKFSRYVIDLNRPLPNGEALYPGQRDDTPVCPMRTFCGNEIYLKEFNLNEAELSRRIQKFYTPYYQALELILENLLDSFPRVLLFDAHSIASKLPGFPGSPFPDFVLGNRQGQTCPEELLNIATDVLRSNDYSVSINEPFQGGQITRYFGEWNPRVYSFQLEMSQHLYLDETTRRKSKDFENVSDLLRSLIEEFADYMTQVESKQ
tara:strand:- start:1039 stop:1860 length:822 start_codon:yes stop_codon:yes gene_type:complete